LSRVPVATTINDDDDNDDDDNAHDNNKNVSVIAYSTVIICKRQ
jgi:hypothetical protein